MKFEKWLQSRLTAHGFPVGGIDGIIGPTTRAAIRAFEQEKGLPVNGTADEEVVSELRKSSTEAITKAQGEAFRELRDTDPVTFKKVKFPRQKNVTSFYGKVGTNQTSIIPPCCMRLSMRSKLANKPLLLILITLRAILNCHIVWYLVI